MKKNMGSLDKVLRLIAGALLVVLIAAGVAPGTWVWVFAAIAAMFIATSLIGFCPLYVPFRISTIPKKKKE
ncbi:DUF2892 domain-containing protein [bacterium]|nr:DUF2892 domain-containing protein [bacterium]